MELIRELFRYMRARRKMWLLPVLTLMLVFGLLTLLTEGTVFAPFIYTLF